MSWLHSTKAEELAAGMAAPDFQLPDQNNQLHTIQQYRDRWLVLYFYPKDDTPGCTKEACAFRDDITELRNLNVEVVGVSVDDPQSHQKFIQKYNLSFPLLSDKGGKVAQQYNALQGVGPLKFAKRHTFIIDPEGKIGKIYCDVKPANHSDEIIQDVKTLQDTRSANKATKKN